MEERQGNWFDRTREQRIELDGKGNKKYLVVGHPKDLDRHNKELTKKSKSKLIKLT